QECEPARGAREALQDEKLREGAPGCPQDRKSFLRNPGCGDPGAKPGRHPVPAHRLLRAGPPTSLNSSIPLWPLEGKGLMNRCGLERRTILPDWNQRQRFRKGGSEGDDENRPAHGPDRHEQHPLPPESLGRSTAIVRNRRLAPIVLLSA